MGIIERGNLTSRSPLISTDCFGRACRYQRSKLIEEVRRVIVGVVQRWLTWNELIAITSELALALMGFIAGIGLACAVRTTGR